MLLLSLLATSVMELLASFMGLRGKNLKKALRNMLASSDVHETVYNDFIENSLFRQLSANPTKRGSEPSYMEDKTFRSILFDVLLKGEPVEKLEEQIEQIPDVDLKNVLRQLYRDAKGDIPGFQQNVQAWYNGVMDRASGWYKRSTQRILLYLGFAIAIIFNADVLSIYARLESDPEKLNQVVGLADTFVRRYGGGAGETTMPYPDNQSYPQPYTPDNQPAPYQEQAPAPGGIQPYPPEGGADGGIQPYQPEGGTSGGIQPYQPDQSAGQPQPYSPQNGGNPEGGAIQPYSSGNPPAQAPPRPYQAPEAGAGATEGSMTTYNAPGDTASIKGRLSGWLTPRRQNEGQLTDPATIKEMQQMILKELKSAESPLGLGWSQVNPAAFDLQDWMFKILGWTVTALAITMGAPFWFDLLQRLVNIKGSGRKPE